MLLLTQTDWLDLLGWLVALAGKCFHLEEISQYEGKGVRKKLEDPENRSPTPGLASRCYLQRVSRDRI